MGPMREVPLRVTVIDPYGVRGGAERWLLELLDVAEGLEPRVIMLREGPLRDDYARRGIPTAVLTTGPSAGAIARAGLRLPRALRAHAPDVLLANGVKAAAVAAVARRRSATPTVWAKHDFSHDRRLGRLLARRVDLVVGTSRAVVESIGLPDAPVLAPPRPSVRPADRAGAAEHWRDLGVDVTTGPTAAVVGRLTPYKRVEDAIRALAFGGCE
ncbi:MAG TPA: glycosyltransferase, partial [Acidimicrobiia bacterium]|nr:glycosyltransferase [Acidimicrobiia bacterium]